MTKTNAEIRAEGEQHVIAELRRRGIEHRLEPHAGSGSIWILYNIASHASSGYADGMEFGGYVEIPYVGWLEFVLPILAVVLLAFLVVRIVRRR